MAGVKEGKRKASTIAREAYFLDFSEKDPSGSQMSSHGNRRF